MSQVELLSLAIGLATEHPDAEIKVCVDNDFVADFGWTVHRIERVELSFWLEVNEDCYTDRDKAFDAVADNIFSDEDYEVLGDEFFADLVNAYIQANSKTVICIFTGMVVN